MHAAHRVGLEDEFHSQAVLINRDVDCVIRQDPRSHTYLHVEGPGLILCECIHLFCTIDRRMSRRDRTITGSEG